MTTTTRRNRGGARRAGHGGLLSDFGHDLPTVPAPPPQAKEPRLFKYAPRRGAARRGRGWAAATAPARGLADDQRPGPGVLAVHLRARPARRPVRRWASTSSPAARSTATRSAGCCATTCRSTNPNIFQFAKPGTGQVRHHQGVLHPDDAVRLPHPGPGRPQGRVRVAVPRARRRAVRHRPRHARPGSTRWPWARSATAGRSSRPRRPSGATTIIFERWLILIRGLVGSMKIDDQRRTSRSVPTRATSSATRWQILTGYAAGNTSLRETTIPQLWDLLRNPTEELVKACEYGTTRQFLDETRLLRNALGELVTGTLAGLFDDHTNIEVDWRAPIQSFSLSRLDDLGDEAVGIALLCLNSWGRGLREIAEPGDLRIVVRDEVWKQMRLGVAAVMSFDADLRLSRGMAGRGGDIQFANCHKPSDLLSVGDAGSQAAMIAKDLLELADIKILGGQKPKVARELDSMLGLGPIAQDLVTGWAMQDKGRALWCVGDATYKVQTVLHPLEKQLYYTNEAIEAAG